MRSHSPPHSGPVARLLHRDQLIPSTLISLTILVPSSSQLFAFAEINFKLRNVCGCDIPPQPFSPPFRPTNRSSLPSRAENILSRTNKILFLPDPLFYRCTPESVCSLAARRKKNASCHLVRPFALIAHFYWHATYSVGEMAQFFITKT